ncbi:MAG: hypothetical protein ACYTHJ_19330 [Planctomycetota bacterium]
MHRIMHMPVTRLFLVGLFLVGLFPLALVVAGGCGVTAGLDFPDRMYGTDGQVFVVEDLERISNNDNLTEEQKREMFRELGIEDEKLIDSLLTL